MDRLQNPYSPGAGTPPPELAGRDELLETVRVAVARVRMGKPTKSVLMVGLRGVGKTVLLDRMRDRAEADGNQTMWVEAPEDRSLPGVLAPQLRVVLHRLSGAARSRDVARRALGVLAGFVGAMRFKYQDVQVGLDVPSIPGVADNGDLEHDLPALFEVVGEAAAKAEVATVLFVDELQYVAEDQLAALIMSMHRTAQRSLPVLMVGAGLPQLRGQMGKAKSYAERLFDFPEIGPLTPQAAEDAIVKPARALGVEFEPDALVEILRITEGYPYFLQEWGKQVWDKAPSSPITLNDVHEASRQAVLELDEGFFRVRFDRLTPAERRYVRAMAELGKGPHRSGDVARVLGKQVTALAPTRAALIRKGMIWSPNHGDTAFTVPLFDHFMTRRMPGDDWKS